MITQEEFDQYLMEFDKLEKRGTFYPMFLNMIEKGFETEAFLFILSTWNFAAFRYAMKDFDLKNFQKIVNGLKPYFNKFKDKSIETINLDDYKKDITYLFDILSEIKGVQFTGSSKIMFKLIVYFMKIFKIKFFHIISKSSKIPCRKYK